VKTRLTIISDTHTRHGLIPMEDLPGGDLLLHAGDIMNSGYNRNDIWDFCHWFQSLKQYEDKVFIAGNHDRMFENHPEDVKVWLDKFPLINYLQDEELALYFDGPNGDMPENNIRIYGLPHTPEFYSWAFNVPRNSHEMQEIMNNIPDNTDILVTHGPPYGILDTISPRSYQALGCEVLRDRVKQVRPKLHIFGHIHGGRGIEYIDGTLFINASVLNEQYEYTNKPITLDFDFSTGEYEIVVK
jgi:Icc-related predicted phosphoesterase